MAVSQVEKIIADTFLEMAKGLETGKFGKTPKIALTGLGSEHGEANALEGAVAAAKSGIDVTLIGTLQHDAIQTVTVSDEDGAHQKMDELLSTGQVDGAVTMHYPFPIGVSTVGRSITSSTDRVEGMVKNAIAGIIAAKACGVKRPTVGILNIDGARQAEGILKQLKENGYDITFAESARADGGCVMRGNDVLLGSCDVMVMDSLTGNVLSKMLSAFHSGGSYEAVGYGYGPGIGEGYDKLVMIVSRASGAKVLQGAIEYAAELIRGDYLAVAKAEFEAANKAGLKELLAQKKAPKAQEASAQAVTAPPKEVVTAQVAGIEIMDLDDAVQTLWKAGIYAESGMGCTGPIVLMSEANHDKAVEELKKAGYIQ